MKKTVTPYLLLLLATMTLVACQDDLPYEGPGQSDRELMQLMKLASPNGTLEYYLLPSSSDYASIPQDPRNPITPAKVELGKLLFHETCISVDGKGASQNFQTWSCASCHHVDAGFQAGVRQGIAEGGMGFGFQGEGRHPIPGYPDTAYDVQPVKSPSILNIAYQEVVLWNGQFGATGPNAGTEAQWTPGSPKEVNHLGYQGVESQAIGAMTVHRLRIDTQMFQQLPEYQYLFNAAFSNLPPEERVTKITAGLAIAAYERTVLANESPFQKWLRGDYSAMNEDQKKGALLFFGKAECSTCHTGPALNSMEFYAFGMKDLLGPDIINADPYDGAHMGRGGFTGKFEDR
jgi:cytochrome c peroxidase